MNTLDQALKAKGSSATTINTSAGCPGERSLADQARCVRGRLSGNVNGRPAAGHRALRRRPHFRYSITPIPNLSAYETFPILTKKNGTARGLAVRCGERRSCRYYTPTGPESVDFN